MAFLLLLALLALHAFSTMGVYVLSDDLAWVQRAVADSHKPWNAFVQPLFGDYYRPIPELVWTLNYRLWGFDFDGHQLMYILMWLAGVCAVYAVGCRLGGRIAGFAAAALVGLNYFYLLIASWKSWYTTLTEFVAVLAWVWATLRWHESRRARYAIASAALAAVAVLSRELAPLVISAIVLAGFVLPNFKAAEEKSRRRAAMWLVVWAVVTGAVLLALPAYRNVAVAFLEKAQGPATAVRAGGAKEISGEYAWKDFVHHTQGIFENWGISRYLLWFATVYGYLRLRRERPAFANKYCRVLLGAIALGAVVFALPWGAGRFGPKANDFARDWIQPVMSGILMLLFCAAAFSGDRTDRLLGAWFVASFLPILVLKDWSGAYHLLAFTALAFFTARALAAFAHEVFLPALARLLGKAPAGREDDARYALVAVLAALLIIEAWMLGSGVWVAQKKRDGIQERVAFGRAVEARVDRAIQGVLKAAGPARRVWVWPTPYAELAGLILQEKYGFKVQRVDQPGLIGAQFSDPLVPIRADAGR